jgi:hypothetical protein
MNWFASLLMQLKGHIGNEQEKGRQCDMQWGWERREEERRTEGVGGETSVKENI